MSKSMASLRVCRLVAETPGSEPAIIEAIIE
jgi:hypothetical protein